MFGITAEQYDEMLARQGGVCANPACDRTVSDDGRRLSVDHDHACCPGPKSCGKCVRGLLCHTCNATLGMVDDDPTRLLGLVAYLGRFPGGQRVLDLVAGD